MTIIARIRLTKWADQSLTAEVPVGRDQFGQPVWARLSGQGIGTVLATVKGSDWEAWKETVKVGGKPQEITRYRTARSWRMTADDTVVGRLDILTVKPEDVPTADAMAALGGATAIAKPEARKPSAPVATPATDLAD